MRNKDFISSNWSKYLGKFNDLTMEHVIKVLHYGQLVLQRVISVLEVQVPWGDIFIYIYALQDAQYHVNNYVRNKVPIRSDRVELDHATEFVCWQLLHTKEGYRLRTKSWEPTITAAS